LSFPERFQVNTTSDKIRADNRWGSLIVSPIAYLHVFALFSLAVSHPLYSVLAQPDHLPFFTAHQSRNIDMGLFILTFSIALPGTLCLVLGIMRLLSKRLASGLFLIIMLTLLFTAQVPLTENWLVANSKFNPVLPAITAVTAVLLYVYFQWARTFLTIMSAAIILSPLLFLASPSIRSYMATPDARDFSFTTRGENQPNIVMIVFDELPLNSLLEENHLIDAVRYPNFHRLSKNSTWFRNTTTTHYATTGAIASLLVGDEFPRYLTRVHRGKPVTSAVLDRSNAPDNLFSLLENHYVIRSIESTSQLARKGGSKDSSAPPLEQRVSLLLADAVIIFAHIAVPESLRPRLPVVEGQWSGFTDMGGARQLKLKSGFPGNAAVVKQFLNQLQRTEKPTLFYLHVLLPHFPFQYSDTGTRHANKFKFLTEQHRHASGLNNWPNEAAANLAWQAHLFQVGFTDWLLGTILKKLEALDMFHESLIIVTADHGISFFWDSAGMQKNQLARIQASETLLVPLLIKLPGQKQQQLTDIPVQTIDILPTIADVLELEIPWESGSFSLLGPIPENRVRFSYVPDRRAFDSVVDPDRLALNRKIQLFGTGSIDQLYHFGPHQEILGRPVASFPVSGPMGNLLIDQPEKYTDIDLNSRKFPAYVEGEISSLPDRNNSAEMKLAVSVNGIIRNTTWTTGLRISELRHRGKDAKDEHTKQSTADIAGDNTQRVFFLARLPAESFSKGENEVNIHAIIDDENGLPLSLNRFSTHEIDED